MITYPVLFRKHLIGHSRKYGTLRGLKVTSMIFKCSLFCLDLTITYNYLRNVLFQNLLTLLLFRCPPYPSTFTLSFLRHIWRTDPFLFILPPPHYRTWVVSLIPFVLFFPESPVIRTSLPPPELKVRLTWYLERRSRTTIPRRDNKVPDTVPLDVLRILHNQTRVR